MKKPTTPSPEELDRFIAAEPIARFASDMIATQILRTGLKGQHQGFKRRVYRAIRKEFPDASDEVCARGVKTALETLEMDWALAEAMRDGAL